MSPKLELISHITPPPFTYPTLPQEPYTTRMIRLLPHKDESAPIQCELFNYDLSEAGDGTHLYQALSYVWGSELMPESIILNGCTFRVTTNLHSALLNLRNPLFERILWIDAICINQGEKDQGHEKSKQIPLMRTIYAQAERVIVWLGDARENGDKALEVIRCLAEEQYTTSTLNTSKNYDACLLLLQRDWFSRIWVLQEVGVARSVYVMCGSVYINGHSFCEGLSVLRRLLDLPSRIGPVIYLIKGALYRSKYELGSRGSISMAELIGMYHSHDATKQHDKVYALLGLSADPITAALEPNYSLPWRQVFKETTSYIFPECSVETWDETETLVIEGKGWILGHINSVEENFSEFGKQKIEVLLNDTAHSLGYDNDWETTWKPQASAVLIEDGDIICLLRGALKPSIIRLCKDHFTVITPAVTPQRRRQKESSPAVMPQERDSMNGLCDIYLTWKTPLAKIENKDSTEVMSPLYYTSPKFRYTRSEAQKRVKHIMLVLIDIVMRISKQGKSKTKAIKQLLRHSGTKDPIIEELVMALTVEDESSAEEDGSSIKTLSQDFLRYQDNDLPISEETVIAATTNAGSHGCIIMELLLQYQGVSLPVSEEVVKAVAGSLYGGSKTIEVLFQHRGKNIPVSEEVVRAAAGNKGRYGPEILKILIQQNKNLPVSEEVVRAAAGNNGGYSLEILKILIQQGKNLPVSEEVVMAAFLKMWSGQRQGMMDPVNLESWSFYITTEAII
ncbi:heterokaryon incompatibility protein-domain-containing protein [Aspergillus sergii]|uniref:Heterokaryon incompatibility protein-domain-containing protein n=1 Tax=Aspergillus sergii TaxID=1034303 RepID=A0A5N6XFU2_9EURO|nr:heterokaryon incompatibility protein-domain-containing protein [Aspergillus sergii]